MEQNEKEHSLRRGGREKDALASVGGKFRAGAGAFKAGLTHFSTNVGTRKTGQSAKAKYEYNNREGKYAKQEEKLTHAESRNMPDWAKDNPKEYWIATDKYERVNGRLFVNAEFALPRELSAEKRIELAKEQCFAMAQTRDGKFLPYSMAIHDGKGHNPHFHVEISERILDGDSRTKETWFKRHPIGAEKSVDLQAFDWIPYTRREWCDRANKYLAAAGSKSRLDHRTLKDQGIDRIATIHVGYSDPAKPLVHQARKERNETIKLANTLPLTRASVVKSRAEESKAEAEAEAALAGLNATLLGKAGREQPAASTPGPEAPHQVREIHAQEPPQAYVKADEARRQQKPGGAGGNSPSIATEGSGAAVPQGAALPTHGPDLQDQAQARTEQQEPQPPTQAHDVAQVEKRETARRLAGIRRQLPKEALDSFAQVEAAALQGDNPVKNLREYGKRNIGAQQICNYIAEQVEGGRLTRQLETFRQKIEQEQPNNVEALRDLDGMKAALAQPGDPAKSLREYGRINPTAQGVCQALVTQLERSRQEPEAVQANSPEATPLRQQELGQGRERELVKPGRGAVSAQNAAYWRAGQAPTGAQRPSQAKPTQAQQEEAMLKEKARLLAEAKSANTYRERLGAERQAKELEAAYLKTLTPAERYAYKKQREREEGRGR